MKHYGAWIKRGVIAAAFVSLFLLLGKIGWFEIASHLQRVGIAGFLFLLMIGVAEAMLDALALQKAILKRVSFWNVLFFNQAGAALNFVAPAESGEVLKASLLTDHAPGKASSAIIIWNVAHRLSKSFVIITAASIAYFSLPALSGATALILGFGLFSIGIYILLSIMIHRGWIGRFVALLGRIPFLSCDFTNRLASRIQEVEQKTIAFWHQHRMRYLFILIIQAGARVACFITIWLALHFLNYGYSFALCMLIYAATELLTYVLALLPTRVGTTEGSAYLLFELLKLEGGLGTIFQVVIRIKQLIVTLSLLLIITCVRIIFRLFSTFFTETTIPEAE